MEIQHDIDLISHAGREDYWFHLRREREHHFHFAPWCTPSKTLWGLGLVTFRTRWKNSLHPCFLFSTWARSCYVSQPPVVFGPDPFSDSIDMDTPTTTIDRTDLCHHPKPRGIDSYSLMECIPLIAPCHLGWVVQLCTLRFSDCPRDWMDNDEWMEQPSLAYTTWSRQICIALGDDTYQCY